MIDLEIVYEDPDVAETTALISDDTFFLRQTQTENGILQVVMLNREVALQAIAAMQAFVEGKLSHASCCALFNSPAFPIAACDCGSVPLPHLSQD